MIPELGQFALILALLLLAFTLATARGRERLMTVYPWIAGVIIVLVVFPHLICASQPGSITAGSLPGLPSVCSGRLHAVDPSCLRSSLKS